jgi:hypothetical protein
MTTAMVDDCSKVCPALCCSQCCASRCPRELHHERVGGCQIEFADKKAIYGQV